MPSKMAASIAGKDSPTGAVHSVKGAARSVNLEQIERACHRLETLLDDEAEHGIVTWTSPTEIARLLLMRRIPRPIPRESDLWRFRVLGAIIPNLDGIIAAEQENLPTPASPILRLHMRPALLAGIAIVERAGPEMLRMLRRHMMGDNKFRFIETTERIIAQARWPRSLQMQLI